MKEMSFVNIKHKEYTVNAYSCLVENYHMDASALLPHIILQHLKEMSKIKICFTCMLAYTVQLHV